MRKVAIADRRRAPTPRWRITYVFEGTYQSRYSMKLKLSRTRRDQSCEFGSLEDSGRPVASSEVH